MIITISEIEDDDKFLYLLTITDKSLLALYASLINTEQYEYCQEVLNEINKRKLTLK